MDEALDDDYKYCPPLSALFFFLLRPFPSLSVACRNGQVCTPASGSSDEVAIEQGLGQGLLAALESSTEPGVWQ
jgi:hypothetical protein